MGTYTRLILENGMFCLEIFGEATLAISSVKQLRSKHGYHPFAQIRYETIFCKILPKLSTCE
jgi:hypothetical protein